MDRLRVTVLAAMCRPGAVGEAQGVCVCGGGCEVAGREHMRWGGAGRVVVANLELQGGAGTAGAARKA